MRHARPLLSLLFATSALCCLPSTSARAQSFYVRSLTSSTFTQRQRLDASVAAPRLLNQGLELYGFDLLDHPDAPLDVRAALRFQQDISAPLDTPLALDLLLISWRPTPSLTLSAGRLWTSTALGPQDLDGATLDWRPSLRGHLTPIAKLFAGRDVQASLAPLAPTTFDVQGLPLFDDSRTPQHRWIAGAQAGVVHTERFSLTAAYQTRWHAHEGTRAIGEERLATATHISLFDTQHTQAIAAYNTLLGKTEHLAIQHLWSISPSNHLSGGASRRRPWFDAASIFNLFDPSPHDDLWAAYRHTVSRSTTLNLRSWLRTYHGNPEDLNSFDQPLDARALGLHLTQRSTWKRPTHTLGVTTRASYQHSIPASAEYPHQWLLDGRVDLALPSKGPALFARAIALRTTRPEHHRLPMRAHAVSAILGLDTHRFSFARLGLQLEQRLTTYGLSGFNIYATIDISRGL